MILEALPLLAMAVLAVNTDEVAGHYYLQGVREVGSELLLKPDGTFQYMLAYGAADYQAEGSWKRDGDVVLLKTAGKEEPPFKLVKSVATKTTGVRVRVNGANGRAVPNIDVILFGSGKPQPQRTDQDGVAFFPEETKPKSVRFEIRVYSLEAGPYEVTPTNNDFYFEINGEAITRVNFKDERLRIDGQALEMRFWNPEQPMRYVKQ